MAQKIVWNKSARIKLDEITTYLEEEYSEETAKKFIRKIFERLDILSRYPTIGRPSKRNHKFEFIKLIKIEIYIIEWMGIYYL